MSTKKITRLIPFFLLLIFLIFCFSCKKDETSVGPTPPAVTQIISNSSLIPTTADSLIGDLIVTDQNGNPIQGLDNNNVVATLSWNNKDKGRDSVFGIINLSPTIKRISASLSMDYSGSMYIDTARIPEMQRGAKKYVEKMNTNDYSEIIKFDNHVILMQGLTNNKQLLYNAIDSVIYFGGGTALYSAMYMGLGHLENVNFRNYIRVVVTITDGGENASTVPREMMINKALITGIPIYTLGIMDDTTTTQALDIKNISDTTGGFCKYIKSDEVSTLASLYDKINAQYNGAYNLAIFWPGMLPPQGTPVLCRIVITYNNFTQTIFRNYNLP